MQEKVYRGAGSRASARVAAAQAEPLPGDITFNFAPTGGVSSGGIIMYARTCVGVREGASCASLQVSCPFLRLLQESVTLCMYVSGKQILSTFICQSNMFLLLQ